MHRIEGPSGLDSSTDTSSVFQKACMRYACADLSRNGAGFLAVLTEEGAPEKAAERGRGPPTRTAALGGASTQRPRGSGADGILPVGHWGAERFVIGVDGLDPGVHGLCLELRLGLCLG